MKKLSVLLCFLLTLFLLDGCHSTNAPAQVAATTLPVYEFTTTLCQGTPIRVTRLITEDVSCLHDYTLQVSQMRALEAAEVIVISGAGLEDFLPLDALSNGVIDASRGISLLSGQELHDHSHDHDHTHNHNHDPHIWLSVANARIMAANICIGLCERYPEHEETIQSNLVSLNTEFDALERYAYDCLSSLSCRELITFHDGFAYLAHSFNLEILEAIEEESGSEASASELIALIRLVDKHELPAIFTEKSGSSSAAAIISSETGADVYTLDMAMSGSSYFEAMYHNINTLKEALE